MKNETNRKRKVGKYDEAIINFTKDMLKQPDFFKLPQEEQIKLAKQYLNKEKP